MTVMEKVGLCLSLAVIVALMYLIIFSKNGVMDYRNLKEKEARIIVQSTSVDKANSKIENEIKSLKTDMEYIKHVAKHEHDMAEEDELIFKDKTVTKGKTP